MQRIKFLLSKTIDIIAAQLPISLFLVIEGTKEQVTLLHVFRSLPGKRLVAHARYQGRSVLIKLFFGNKANRDFEKEKRGLLALHQKQILSPAYYFGGYDSVEDIHFIISEFIESAIHFNPLCIQKEDFNLSLSLAIMMVQTIAEHHAHGLIQDDIHPGNFLIANRKVYTIDGGSIIFCRKGEGLSSKDRLYNLAKFLAHFPLGGQKALITQCFNAYQQINDSPGFDLNTLLTKSEQLHRWRLKRYLKKTVRSCSEFVRHQSMYHLLLCRRECWTAAWQEILLNIEGVFIKGNRIKSGSSATVVHIVIEGHSYIIKRYQLKNFWHAALRGLRSTRAANAWNKGYLLRFAGINTPLPIALIEKRIGVWRREAYLVTEANDGLTLQCQYEQTGTISDSHIAQVINTLDAFALYHISHGDMKGSNLLGDEYGVAVIDLDSMTYHRHVVRLNKALCNDKNRFLRCWQSDATVQERFIQMMQHALNRRV